jgi:heptosyltransferase-1
MTPPAVDMASVRRVLIIKLSALGDIIHALPVSAALGEAFPHLELTWAVEEAFTPLISGNPYLAHVFPLPKIHGHQLRSPAFHREYFRRMRDVRNRRFDLTLDLQGLTKSAFVAAMSGARVRLGYHWLREAAAFFERPIPRRPGSVHIVEQYLDVARFLGADATQVHFPFHIPEEEEQAVQRMLEAQGIPAGTDYISVNPASALALKQWSAESYAALMDRLRERLNVPMVLVTADKAVAAKVQAAAKQPFVDLAGGTNLKQLAAVLRRNLLHICGDTGSGHLAAALGRPVVSLMGPTDAERLSPYGQRRYVIRHREVCSA